MLPLLHVRPQNFTGRPPYTGHVRAGIVRRPVGSLRGTQLAVIAQQSTLAGIIHGFLKITFYLKPYPT